MKHSKLALFVIPVILLIAVCGFGQKRASQDSKNNRSATTQVPKDWKLVTLGGFSMMMPKSMKDQEADGIDSQVWEFEDDDFFLSIDSGRYTNDFQDSKEEFKVREEKEVIDGKNVKFLMWNENKPFTGSYETGEMVLVEGEADEPVEKPFALAAYFLTSKKTARRPKIAVGFYIVSRNEELRETAKKILQSIKFKK